MKWVTCRTPVRAVRADGRQVIDVNWEHDPDKKLDITDVTKPIKLEMQCACAFAALPRAVWRLSSAAASSCLGSESPPAAWHPARRAEGAHTITPDGADGIAAPDHAGLRPEEPLRRTADAERRNGSRTHRGRSLHRVKAMVARRGSLSGRAPTPEGGGSTQSPESVP